MRHVASSAVALLPLDSSTKSVKSIIYKTINEKTFYSPDYADGKRLLKCVIVGGGNRGQCYAKYAEDFPHLIKIVAIADPRLHVRKLFARKYGIPVDMQFQSWKDIVALDKIADFVCICTPDKLHKEPAVAFAKKKYHVLLEKPMATNLQESIEIAERCKENNVMMSVCHVLRYSPAYRKIKELIDSGVIGNVLNIQHLEPVGYWKFAHSYVRGNWRNTAQSTFSLLAKSSHDLDLISFWMNGQRGSKDKTSCECTSVSSFGSLTHFKTENKPTGAGMTCFECPKKIERSCPYSAKRIYLDKAEVGYWDYPALGISDIEDITILRERLRNGPYGRCVYACDNDVCDNQVVNLQFNGGQTATFSMVACSECTHKRRSTIFGTMGEINYIGDNVKHYDYLTGKTVEYSCKTGAANITTMQRHGGADFLAMDAFVKAVMYKDPSYILTGPEETLESHILVFAAEESRITGKIVNVSQFKNQHMPT